MRFALLSNLVTRVRAAVGYESNPHVSDAELGTVLKSAARSLLDVLLEIHGPEPYRELLTIGVFPGISRIELPTQVKEVLSVYTSAGELVGGAVPTVVSKGKPYSTILPFEEWERVALLNSDYTDHRCLRWRLGGAEANDATQPEDVDVIELLPVPQGYVAVHLSIVPHPVQAPLSDGDVRLLAPGCADDWLVAAGCSYVRVKEKDDPTPFRAVQAELEARIKATHSRRTTHEPARMRGRRLWRPGDYAEDWE